MSTDPVTFFRAWLSNPGRVGSVIPSGRSLARLILREIDPRDGAVLELGPGTGVFTRALIRRGVPPEALTLVELGPEFAGMLAQRYPEALILRIDAARLASDRLGTSRRHGAAISGLPLLSMRPRKVMRVLAGVFGVLKDDANLYQFTYGWKCPVPQTVLARLGLKATRIGTAFSNFPPASVYRISRLDQR